MIHLNNLCLRRGIKTLLNHAHLTLNPGNRVGVIGANGVGKSTLFALLMGQLTADAGDALIPPHWQIAHVSQETLPLTISALDFALNGDQELRQLEARLSIAEQQNDGLSIAYIHDELTRIDAWSAPARAARLLNGLGFDESTHSHPVANFSGGWRMRLNLAQALMCRSDLLLLDEPTNHLDIETVLWLEEWLIHYPGTLLVISHDRDFLDKITTHIVEFAQQTLTLYTGNYSQYEVSRAEKLAHEQQAYQKQCRHIAHLESFISRFRAKATKARQVQSRIKALEKLDRLLPAHIDSPYYFSFDTPDNLPNPLITLNQVSVGYASAPTLSNITLSIETGSRIGLLGVNGAGKSTLIKLLAGQLAPLKGERLAAAMTKIGYFAQHQLEALRLDDTPLKHLMRIAPTTKEQELRDFLGSFHFPGAHANNLVSSMSGGEKARLALALIIWQKPNLLLLDEPTNHLDLEMRHALTLALQGFSGAVVIVSHDRALLEACTDTFWLIHSGVVEVFDGDLEDYHQWRLSYPMEATGTSASLSLKKEARKEHKRQEAKARQHQAQQRQPLKTRLAELDQQLTILTAEKAALETYLSSEETYTGLHHTELMQRLRRQQEVSHLLTTVEEEWLKIQEQLDALNKPSTL